MTHTFSISVIMLIIFVACSDKTQMNTSKKNISDMTISKTDSSTAQNTELPKTEAEWKSKLTTEEFEVLRKKGTEMPFTGKYTAHAKEGIYVCKGCGTELFSSNSKFDSHCGWPSFYEGIDKSKIKETRDISHGMIRTEVTCARCGGHLGHVFDDGPKDKTGLRYCINSVSLGFVSLQQYDSINKK